MNKPVKCQQSIVGGDTNAMKRILILSFLLLALIADARKITPDEALEVAQELFNTTHAGQQKAPRAQRVKTANVASEALQPYYVFNASGNNGFVIVAGDDRATKILGYSDHGTFDSANLPPQLAAMLGQYAGEIQSLAEGAPVDESWGRKAVLCTTSDSDELILKTVDWGQDYPYNLQCPKVDGVNCVTGCVATAMAIVMKYHNWPEQGYGSNIIWNMEKRIRESFNYDDIFFDWSNMADSYDESSSDISREEVAKLMNVAGYSVNMSYGVSESGAEAAIVGHALRTHFRYAESCEFIHSRRYTAEEWLAMLRDELDNGHPVIYHGGNHMFVCDGYNSDGLFHFNWGWNGAANGFYALSAMNPNGGNFSYDHAMVHGIVPDHSGRLYSDAFVDGGYSYRYDKNYYGAQINVENIEAGVPFFFNCRMLTIPIAFSGDFGVAIVDNEGKVKSVLDKTTFVGRPDSRMFRPLEYTLTCDIEPEATDRIQVVAKRTTDADWLPVRGTSEAPSWLPVKGNTAAHADVELFSNVDYFACYASSGETLAQGHNTIPMGAELSWFFHEHYDGVEETCVVVHDGQAEILLKDIPYLVYEGSYKIYFIASECSPLSVTLSEAGTLADKVSPEKAVTVSELKVSGSMNISDFEYIRSLFVHTKKIDITEATIEGGIFDNIQYEPNILPALAFSGMSELEYVFLPQNIVAIGPDAFFKCNIMGVDIPQSVTYIDGWAFYYNSNLTTVIVHSLEPVEISQAAFVGTPVAERGVLYVPTGAAEAYRGADVWGDFAAIEEGDDIDYVVIDYVSDGIVYKLFPMGRTASIVSHTSKMPSDVVIPETIPFNGVDYTVTAIYPKAFYDCVELKSFVMPNTVTEIGESAFMMCYNLVSVKLSESLEVLPMMCFCYCYALEVADIPKNVKYIDGGAFDINRSLKRIHLPANTKIADEGTVFNGLSACESITVDAANPYYCAENDMLFSKDKKTLIVIAGAKEGEVAIPEYVENLPWRLFYEMPNLTAIRLPESYSGDIPYQFVYRCPRLVHVTLPDSALNTSTETLSGCESLESLTVGRNLVYGTGIRGNQKLKHVFLRNKAKLDILQLFNDGMYKEMSFYTDQTAPTAILDACDTFFVPGACADRFAGIADCTVSEMWSYIIDRNAKALYVMPQIAGVTIDRVTVNGSVVEPVNTTMYPIGEASEIDVVVDFTLLDRQAMTTHYDADFNAALPDTRVEYVSQIVLNETSLDLHSHAQQLRATVYPENASHKKLLWTSSDPEVATVDGDGVVTPVSNGNAVITAHSTDGSGISASCDVSVTQIFVESIELDPTEFIAIPGHLFEIDAYIYPENALNKMLKWSSSNEAVAVVECIPYLSEDVKNIGKSGLVSVLSKGDCIITAETIDGSGIKAECVIKAESGIADIYADGAPVDVYNTTGVLLKKSCGVDAFKQLPAGVYIVRSGNVVRKVMIP